MKQPPPRKPAAPIWVEPAPRRSIWPGTRKNRMTAGLVGLSGAAILSVYAVGYLNTSAAEDQLTANMPDGSLPGAQGGPGAPLATPRVQRGPFGVGRDDEGEGGQQPRQNAPAVTPTPASPGGGQQPRQNAPTATPTPVPANPGGGTSGGAPSQQQASGYHDGTFTGVGNSRHGGMQVSVVVKGGQLVSASITGCGTRYPCSKVSPLVTEVLKRQGPPVDYVSGATDSSMAYIQAVRAALSQASASAS